MYFTVYSCCVAPKFYGCESNNLRSSITGVHRSLAKQDKLHILSDNFKFVIA